MKLVGLRRSLLKATIDELNLHGSAATERVVLWFGSETEERCEIEEAFIPTQETGPYHFVIPPEGMQEILKHIKATRLKIIAQVHSHPHEAFHSIVDDGEAILRHEGALSLVLPRFALGTSIDSFFRDAAVYELSGRGTWDAVPPEEFKFLAYE